MSAAWCEYSGVVRVHLTISSNSRFKTNLNGAGNLHQCKNKRYAEHSLQYQGLSSFSQSMFKTVYPAELKFEAILF